MECGRTSFEFWCDLPRWHIGGLLQSSYNDAVKDPIAVVNKGSEGLVPLEVSFKPTPPGTPAGVASLSGASAHL